MSRARREWWLNVVLPGGLCGLALAGVLGLIVWVAGLEDRRPLYRVELIEAGAVTREWTARGHVRRSGWHPVWTFEEAATGRSVIVDAARGSVIVSPLADQEGS